MVGNAATVAVDAKAFASLNGVLALAVSAAPLLSAELVDAPLHALARFVPLLGKLLAELLRRVSIACENVRLRREQLFVLTHGAITYALGDAIAQIALTPADAPTLLWEPSKTVWAALIGLVSDALPFYHWSSFLASFDIVDGPRRMALERRMPLIKRKPELLLPLKVVVHLATIQPFSTALYLFMQGLLRDGGDVTSALTFLGARFGPAVLPALATFLVGGPLIYSLPVVAGAALRNLGVLAMCIYLAVVASR